MALETSPLLMMPSLRLRITPWLQKGTLIYVKAGVYEEYVSIEKKKKYLMMIGDGINQIIITGNRSVVDGWTTFKSATFVKNSKSPILNGL
ncbi:putative pectinesterase/pectinesterase inhibitor 7 [Morus notabilis]|uniref:Putative pectinesterase/pectinesterase inhibitor 7 n=1 Tax=Morus notabilis TaxID=981085 RepID=W9R122_9ROSA|nr:putative pectinesterase/pectinesterase inhibitor 7 [Morus notabilis]EXB33526.1 putative pectinesterase/pectinesterase inhibitor 7 [Morus notabilis]